MPQNQVDQFKQTTYCGPGLSSASQRILVLEYNRNSTYSVASTVKITIPSQTSFGAPTFELDFKHETIPILSAFSSILENIAHRKVTS